MAFRSLGNYNLYFLIKIFWTAREGQTLGWPGDSFFRNLTGPLPYIINHSGIEFHSGIEESKVELILTFEAQTSQNFSQKANICSDDMHLAYSEPSQTSMMELFAKSSLRF